MERPQVKTLLQQGDIYLRTQAHESYCSVTSLEHKRNGICVKAEHVIWGLDKNVNKKLSET